MPVNVDENNNNVEFALPKNQSSVIKVIGVGGGGSNAVNYMYTQGIHGVDFVVCNTDAQALENSPIPNKIQLGASLTEGLGAGANPEVGEQSARESLDEINRILEHNTKMVFITAGMGGGTGTGAAPIIAQSAKEMGILTVGIVTSPFGFEGAVRQKQATEGIERLRKSVDSLIVINNNKLREVYGNLGYKAGYAKADEVLATAARGIAEVITHHFTTNIDLKDAKTVLADSGTAIMGSGTASGEDRANNAIKDALNSPLLNDNHIHGARNVLLLIISGTSEITIDEISDISEYVQREAGGNTNIILGIGEDESIGESIAVTIIATGFAPDQQRSVIHTPSPRVIHTLEEDQAVTQVLAETPLKLEDAPLPNTPTQKVNTPPATPEGLGFQPVRGKDRSANEQQIQMALDMETPIRPSNKLSEPEPAEEQNPQKISPEEPLGSFAEDESPGFTFVIRDLEEEEDLPQAAVNEPEMAPEEMPYTHFSSPTSVEDEVEIAAESSVTEGPIMEFEAPVQEERRVIKLEEFVAFERQLKGEEAPEAPAPKREVETEIEPELRMEKRALPQEEVTKAPIDPSSDPFERPISESAQRVAESRKARLESFNYRFKNGNLKEAENIPAYKRQGIDIPSDERHSRNELTGQMSVDDNGIKRNNRFLHDNVD